jgi:predicted 3-demethylubiquinone-9 3-methyltransferase (glyoxalase superfamily)
MIGRRKERVRDRTGKAARCARHIPAPALIRNDAQPGRLQLFRVGRTDYASMHAVIGAEDGGPMFKQTECFSFQIATDDQEETDRYWHAIVGNGGQESACGWCKDRWGVSWQITPRTLTEALAAGGGEAKRAFDAMMDMRKIDVAVIDAARRG